MTDGTRRIGRIGEFKLCALLEKWGFTAIYADTSGYDVIAEGQWLTRIQCKTSNCVTNSKDGAIWNMTHAVLHKRVPYSRDDADVFALYWMPLDKFIFLPVNAQTGKSYSISLDAIPSYDERKGYEVARCGMWAPLIAAHRAALAMQTAQEVAP